MGSVDPAVSVSKREVFSATGAIMSVLKWTLRLPATWTFGDPQGRVSTGKEGRMTDPDHKGNLGCYYTTEVRSIGGMQESPQKTLWNSLLSD